MSCETRQARKGATVIVTLGAGVWLVRLPPMKGSRGGVRPLPTNLDLTPGEPPWNTKYSQENGDQKALLTWWDNSM